MTDLILVNDNGNLCFGNYSLDKKEKKEGFQFNGSTYKVKTYKDITKIEKDESFLYESVPGTIVSDFKQEEDSISFYVKGFEDPQITLGLEEETEYCIKIQDKNVGCMKTNLGGKLSLSLELNNDEPVKVEVYKSNK